MQVCKHVSMQVYKYASMQADLEKAANGASGAFGHFVGNHVILRTFRVKYSVILNEDGLKGLTIENLALIKKIRGKRMENGGL